MKLYTLREIHEDIRQHEGCEFELPDDIMATYNDIRYTCLYSEYNPTPLSNNATVAQLQERIVEFADGSECAIPAFDFSPENAEEGYIALAYRLIGPATGTLKQSRIEFIQAVKEQEELQKLLSRESNETALCVVFLEEKQVSYYRRGFN